MMKCSDCCNILSFGFNPTKKRCHPFIYAQNISFTSSGQIYNIYNVFSHYCFYEKILLLAKDTPGLNKINKVVIVYHIYVWEVSHKNSLLI